MSKKKLIESLTPEQEAKFPEYVEKWVKVGLMTETIDQEKAKAAVSLAYKKGGLTPPPEFVFVRSPIEAIDYINKRLGNKKDEYIGTTLEGQHNAGLVAFYQFFRDELGLVEETEDIMGIMEVTLNCGWCYLYDVVAVICDRYEKIYRDDIGRLHCEDGPAIAYRDGYSLYFWHGTPVEAYVIEEPEKITLEDIMKESNQEVKRVKIIQFGIDRLISCNSVKLIDNNPEFGELYHTTNMKDINNKPYAFLKVINSTHEIYDELDQDLMKIQGQLTFFELLEKQGQKLSKEEEEEKNLLVQKTNEIKQSKELEYKVYALRVNPDIKDAQAAWQSTFGLLDNFLPDVES